MSSRCRSHPGASRRRSTTRGAQCWVMTTVTEGQTHATDPPPDRPRYPLSKAAEMAGVSHSTMKRRLRDGSFPGAIRNADGAWLLSVEDLLGAGLTLRGPGQVMDQVQPDVTPGPDPDLVERITVLEL